ncbi:hypothetical protein [Arthrobacter sp.]|uniref:hypothetical protein n=1 Tax=Arthrobacter sp. TaxID=1667 RepID=UPI002811D131|nr:hypothetical protein [Arthrobacter sp.]
MTVTGIEARVLPALQQRADGQGSRDEVLRLLTGFAALGSGMTFFALAADSILARGGPGSLLLGGAVGLWALSLTAWGIVTLRGGHGAGRPARLLTLSVPVALPAAAAVVLAVLSWSALLAPAGSRELDLTLVSALALVLLQLGCLGTLRRRSGRQGRPASPGKLLAGLFFSAVLVAGITTPGLAASTAGEHAVPHGQHGSVPVPADHPDH